MLWIDQLRWDEQAEEHIARHHVSFDEVEEAVENMTHARRERGYYSVIGKTEAGRYLKIVLDREDEGLWYVVTALNATTAERRLARRKSTKGVR